VPKTTADNTNDDENLPQGVARLFDMDTREVSLVDHPANKRRLLVVKRDGATEELDVTAPVTDQITVTAPTTAALDQMNKALSASEETPKMSQPNATQTPAPAAPSPATTAKAEAPVVTPAIAPVAKVGRPMNGDRLERLKAIHKNFKEALGELRGGQVSLEKFDAAAHGLATIISECDVTKLLESVRAEKAEKTAKMANGFAGSDTRSASPNNPNMGAGVQPDVSAVAGAEAVFGDGVPAGVADLVKNMQARLDSIEKRNAILEKKNSNLQTEVVSLKKFRDAPSALEDGEAEEILSAARTRARSTSTSRGRPTWPRSARSSSRRTTD
jgi:hypothetical protein